MTDGGAPRAIRFRCPHCRRSVRVAGQLAGKHGRCPKCQGAVRVPETPLGDKLAEALSVPLPLLYTVQSAICGVAILWGPLLYDPKGMAHLAPYAWTLLVVAGLGLVALHLLVGRERVTVAKLGVILGNQTILWKDVVSVDVSTSTHERKGADALDCTAELTTKEETHRIPRSFCLAASDHWIRLLDPRYRARVNRDVADSIQALFGAKKTKKRARLLARERSAA